jgi:hypothetical protein
MGRCYEYIKGAHHRDDIAPLTNKEIHPCFDLVSDHLFQIQSREGVST